MTTPSPTDPAPQAGAPGAPGTPGPDPGAGPDRVLDERYELLARLGSGGSAEVWRARDRVLGREVALKVLHETTGDPHDRERFTAEARTLAALSHRHLVMLLDAGTAAARPYLVLELVRGPSLAEVLRTGPLDLPTAARLGRQVAEALAYAHGRGVVHRDVKPANVLLTAAGPAGEAKLADFGIARLLDQTTHHTRTGTTVGTAAYLAPEQVEGARELTGAVDVYALGLVLLEAVTGRRAFPGTPTEAAVARLARGPEVPDDLPAGWRDLVTATCRRDPAARPSAAAVAEALATLTHDPATAPALTPTAPGATRVMTAATAAPATTAAHPPPGFADRAGDALARAPHEAAQRWGSLESHHRGLAGALVALVVLLVVVALAAGGSNGEDAPQVPREAPSDAPSDLRGPLQDLHDAVGGR